jgi:hypothetical protein
MIPVTIRYTSEEESGLCSLHLFGIKEPHDDGWVYRLYGCAVTADDDGSPLQVSAFRRLVLYVTAAGRIVSASAATFRDEATGEALTWHDLEFVLAHCETADLAGETADMPLTTADWADAFRVTVEAGALDSPCSSSGSPAVMY